MRAACRVRLRSLRQTYEWFERAAGGKCAEMAAAAIVDIDGTLVDTNYHHALAWYRAFRQHEIVLALYRIHRHIGMGGDQLVAALCGEDVEEEKGDDIRAAEGPLYMAMIEEVEPLSGARDLLAELKESGHPVVLASSAKAQEVEHYLDLLDARDLADGWTTSADVDATKPEPDLVEAAMQKVEADEAVMVGDSTWDCEAAKRAGIETVAVLTGGFSEQELREAGASMVFESIESLRDRIGETPLGR
jgi:HAD superfamily hydrolase (TIGR01509 family)